MLNIQLLTNIGDIVQNISQFSSNLDQSVIHSVQEFITKMNTPFFKYVPEIKIWHISGLLLGVAVPYLNFEKQQEFVTKLLQKYPNRSVIFVATAGLIIWLLVV